MSEARLNVVIDPSGAESGAKRVSRSLNDIRNSSKEVESRIEATDRKLAGIMSSFKNLAHETSVAAKELRKLSKSGDFENLEQAKHSVAGLKELRSTLSALQEGYHDVSGELKEFIEVQATSGIHGMKSHQAALKATQKELDATGKELESLSKKATREMSSAERAVGQFEKQAKKALDSVSRSGKRMLAVFLSWRALKSLFGLFIGESVNREKAEIRLQSALKSTGHAAGLTATEIGGMAKELSRMTAYSEGAITSMQTILTTFKNVKGDTFKQASVAVLNLATALGGDLQSNAMRVGKALENPRQAITALRSAGIDFNDEQKKTIKRLVETGDVLGAQKIILAEIETRYGKLAEATGKSLGGALQKMHGKIRELFDLRPSEKLGNLIVRINKLSDSLTSQKMQDAVAVIGETLVDGLSLSIKGAGFLADNIDKVKIALLGLASVKISSSIMALLTGLGFLAGAPVGVTAAVTGLGGAGIAGGLYTGWKVGEKLDGSAKNKRIAELEKRMALDQLYKGDGLGVFGLSAESKKEIEEKIKSATGKLKETAKVKPKPYTIYGGESSGKGKKGSKSGKSEVALLIEDMRDQIDYLKVDAEHFLPILDEWKAKLKPLSADWKLIMDMESKINEGLTRKASEEYRQQSEAAESTARALREVTDELSWLNQYGFVDNEQYLSHLKEIFEAMKSQLADPGVQNWTNEMRSIFEKMESLSGEKVRNAMEALKIQFENGKISLEQYRGALGLLVAEFEGSPTSVRKLEEAITGLDNAVSKSKLNIEMLIESSNKALEGQLLELPDALTSAFSRAIAYGEDLGETLKNIAKDLAYAIIKATLFNALFGGSLKGVPSAGGLFGAAHGAVFSSGNLVPFAQGGIVNRPTVFPFAKGVGLMGEAGAEAIMPLKRTSSGDLGVKAEGGGGMTNITMNINAVDSKSFVEMMRTNKASVESIVVENIMRNGAVRGAIRGMA